MNVAAKKSTGLRRVARIFLKSLLGLLLVVLALILSLHLPFVQRFVRQKAVSYLETKLKTNVEVGGIYVGFPRKIILEDVFVADRNQDTLLSGGSIRAKLDLWKLIFKNELIIDRIALEDITANLTRESADSSFNFQFIVDAFMPVDSVKKTMATDTAAALSIGRLTLDNVNFRFKDVITGSDIKTRVDYLDAKIPVLDGARMIYEVNDLVVKDMQATVIQTKPLASPTPSGVTIMPVIAFNEASLEKVNVTYINDVSGLTADANIGKLEVNPANVDLVGQHVHLSTLLLHDSKIKTNMRKQDAMNALATTAEDIAEAPSKGWRFAIDNLDLVNTDIAFANDNLPRSRYGIDFAHLDATALTLKAKDFYTSNDTISAMITEGSFREKSGFVLEELRSDFLYATGGFSLKDLYLKTPGTEIKDQVIINYYSPEVLAANAGSMQLDVDLQDSRLLVRDLLAFVPDLQKQPAFANANATWYINTRLTGKLSDLDIHSLKLTGLSNTRIDLSGDIKGLPDMKNFAANLDIRTLSSTKQDLLSFIPKNQIPQNIEIPAWFNMSGNVQTEANAIRGNLDMRTALGNANISGTLRDPSNVATAAYTISARTSNLNLGALLRNPGISGPISATVTATGRGFDPKTARTHFNGVLNSAVIKGYNYGGLKFDGNIADQQATVNASIADPNIHFAVAASADLGSEYPSVKVTGMIDSIKMQALNLSKDEMIVRGKIDADFPVTNPDYLKGRLLLTQSLFVFNDQRLNLDTVELVSGRSDSANYIRLRSDVATANLEGNYRLSQLPSIFQQAIEPYFSVTPGRTIITSEPYDFMLNAYIIDNPALKAFLPDLERIDSVTLNSRFANSGWNATLNAPVFDMGPNHLRNLRLTAGTGDSAIAVNGSLEQWTSGKLIQLQNTTFTASLANNAIDFNLNSKDRSYRDKYNLAGILRQQGGNYEFTLSPDSLLLNYDLWSVTPNNKLIIYPNGVNATNFTLSRAGQQLTARSLMSGTNSPLEVNFSNFQLATLTGFIQTDSTFATGTINGNVTLTDISKPLFTADLTVTDLTYKSDSVGNLRATVNAKTSDTYITDITLTGKGNDVSLSGTYYPQRSNSLDLDLNLRALPVTTLQAFSDDAIRDGSGFLSGQFAIDGNIARPLVNGNLAFNNTGFTFGMLNSHFAIDKETVQITPEGFKFDRFRVLDSAGNALTINGTAATRNFMNYKFDLSVRANDFQFLNSTKKDNPLFYGRLFFNTNLRVLGTEASPMVDGTLVVNEKTQMSFVLPQKEPGIVEREGIIEFVDMDAPLNDSLFLATMYDSLNISGFTGMDISVNLTVSPEAEFSLVIDEGNGDFLNVKGEASLTAGIDPSGKITLVGTYDIDQGSYELTFNFLKRKFNIEKGSRIVWEGEPTNATVNVKAVYVANAAPLDLVKDQLGEVTSFERNTYLQKLPFDVHLAMEGNLMQPQITFDIVLPESRNYAVDGNIVTNVRTRLDQLRQEEGEMNKQVFSLLLLNRFMSENPFSSSAGAINAGALARQSVSKLLTEQLNALAGELIAGVDINFDILASEDYTTGERKDRTDLNVGLSKRLLNDRLTVSIGSNFALEGPQGTGQQSNNIAGDIALDYRISKDNRYVLRAYRKNEYQGVIDGYIIETGVGFIITLDYNKLKEIFLSKSEREQRRNRRQEERRKAKQDTTTVTDTIPYNEIKK